jgi:hypothetical protein
MKRLLPTCLIAATSLAGCSSSDTPTEADYDDVAQALTAVVVTDNEGGEVGAMIDATSIAAGDGKITLQLDTTGKYTGNHLGLNYAYSAVCSNAEGAALTACDKSSDSADVAVSFSGELALPRLSAAVVRDGSWQLSGLQSEQVTFAGESELSLDTQVESLFRDATRAYRLNYVANYDAVVLDRAARRVVSGKVMLSVDSVRMATGTRGESEAQFNMDGVLEFKADGTASLTLDGSHNYKVHMGSGGLTKTNE